MPKLRKIAIPYVKEEFLTEKLKSEVQSMPVKFPKDLGEEHPFNFEECGKVYKKIGFPRAAIDKHLDFIISPGFHVTSEEKKAEVLINKFIRDTSFDQLLRAWILEALVKGNGFLEIGVNKKEIDLKVVNANHMYIKRNKHGEVIKYHQYVGGFEKFSLTKAVPFEPEEIIHLPIGEIGDDAYGYGLMYPALVTLDNIVSMERDLHMLIKRKANAPYVANVGSIEEPATQQDITDIGQRFEYLNNMHEWAFDHKVKLTALDFGNLGDKFSFVLEHDRDMLFYIFQTPAVLMGMANVAEGLGEKQGDGWERRIQSLQGKIEKVVEEKIFRRILQLNGFDAHVEMEWSQPDAKTTNNRVQQLTVLMGNLMISPPLRAMIEIDIAKTLGYKEEDIALLAKPSQMPQQEREEEEGIEQPEIPGEKPQAREMKEILTEADELSLKEWLNFDYQQYRKEVLEFIQKDKFELLAGKSRLDYDLGLLTPTQLRQLKSVFKDKFESGGSIIEISRELEKLKLKDRFELRNGKKVLTMPKEFRPINIARTESTRVATGGLLNNYQSKGIENVRFLASISERTCPICLGLNGQVFNISEARTIIPVHPMCRCSYLAVME